MSTEELDLIEGLEAADQSAVKQNPLPPALCFDPDSKRGGMYGGFYAAEDQVPIDRYEFVGARTEEPFRERDNGTDKTIPCVKLGPRVHFALVAAGPRYKRKGKEDEVEKYYFEAIVLVREIIDRTTNKPALFKLTAKGVPAVRLHSHLTADLAEPLARLTKHSHETMRRLYAAKDPRVTEERYQNVISRSHTPQEIWIPVDVAYKVKVGKEKNTQKITIPNTHRRTGENGQYESLWSEVPTEQLALIDTKGGLRLSPDLAAFCRENRQKYEAILQEKADRSGQLHQVEAEQISGEALEERTAVIGTRQTKAAVAPPPPQESGRKASEIPARTPAENSARQALIKEVNDKIELTGKTKEEVKTYLRLKYQGKEKVEDLTDEQLAEFNKMLDKKLKAAE